MAEHLFQYSDVENVPVSSLIADLIYRAVEAGEFDLESSTQQRLEMEDKAS